MKIRNLIYSRIICNNGTKENKQEGRSEVQLLNFYSIYEKLKYMYMPHFKAFGVIYLQYETMKPQMTKTSQDNNLNYIYFLKHFYEYHIEKLKYRDVTCLILKVFPWWICYYCFCSHIQPLVELESVIEATSPCIEHTAPLTYSLWMVYPICRTLFNE